MTSEAVVREIVDGNVERIIAFWHASGVARPWNDPAADIAFARRGPHSTILVAMLNGSVAATAMVGEDGHRGWVYYVATAPERRGGGLGRAVMAAAEAWLAGRGVREVQLLVRGDNADAKRFYERLGYHDARSVCLQKVIGPLPR